MSLCLWLRCSRCRVLWCPALRVVIHTAPVVLWHSRACYKSHAFEDSALTGVVVLLLSAAAASLVQERAHELRTWIYMGASAGAELIADVGLCPFEVSRTHRLLTCHCCSPEPSCCRRVLSLVLASLDLPLGCSVCASPYTCASILRVVLPLKTSRVRPPPLTAPILVFRFAGGQGTRADEPQVRRGPDGRLP